MEFPISDLIASAPIVFVAILAFSLLVVDFFTVHDSYRSAFAALVCAAAWLLSYWHYYLYPVPQTSLVAVDHFAFVFSSLILGGGFMTFLLHDQLLSAQRIKVRGVDVDVLILFAMVGAMVMVSAANLIVIFLGFELLSISVYVLTGVARDEKASTEGALKYFILGAFSSAFLLYGMTLVYAATQSMELREIANVIRLQPELATNPLLLIGLGMIVFGFGFKVALVPFHFWTPDVYQGAPVSIATFMAVVVKAAAVGSFLRIMAVSFGELSGIWAGLIWSLAVGTITIGNLLALMQRSVKRMLAYSSVAHAGYLLLGVLSLGTQGGQAVVFYIVVYALMTIASFGALLVVTAGTNRQYFNDDVESFRGLGWRSPFLSLIMVIALLSLAGMPPLAGFVGKLFLFGAAVHSGYVGLAIIAALNSVVSLYYYLRVIIVMYFEEVPESAPDVPLAAPRARLLSGFALACATGGTVYFGIDSRGLVASAAHAMLSLGAS